MPDAHRARAECRSARIAQTASTGLAGARRSPSHVMNASMVPDAQEQQGSSQPVTEHRDGLTATRSLVQGSGATSHAWSEMPHGRCALAMATKLLRYRPGPDRYHDWLQCIEALVPATGDSAALSYLLRPQLSQANDKEQDAPPPPPRQDVRPEPRQKTIPNYCNNGARKSLVDGMSVPTKSCNK
ncbi:hypothetical protein D1007_13944 [Hordeum vulgare]|nr:hypothetical protein D1007_13944 [Hordeum vulgare]